MSSQIHFKGIALKKTKLGESDLIITFLAEDGSLMQGVARGARKPKSSFATRLELFSCVEVFCVQGKGLPLVQEARLVRSHQETRDEFDKSTAASIIAELVVKSSHENVPVDRLFLLVETALESIDSCDSSHAYVFVIAACLKSFAFMGLRPSFTQCVSCGQELLLNSPNGSVALSHYEGGCLCPSCAGSFEVTYEYESIMQWLNVLLFSTFEQISKMQIPSAVISCGLHFLQEWARVHVGARLKSIPFALTNASL